MKKVMNVFLITLFITTAASERMLHPVVLESFADTSADPAATPDERTAPFGAGKRDRFRSFSGLPGENPEKYCPGGYHHRYNEPVCPGMMFHHTWRRPFMNPLFVASCLFVWLAINILLTVLVWRDMMRRSRFNGLWIPVLLLMGVPGTGLYALFRIGDAVAEKK